VRIAVSKWGVEVDQYLTYDRPDARSLRPDVTEFHMFDLYIANKNYSSWSLRPWVLMRALGIGFNEKLVPFVEPGQPNPFTVFSPTGKVPCLVDGSTTVWDSLAITEYLADLYPMVWPREAAMRAWARCASAEMHSGFANLREVCSMNCGIRVRIDTFSPAVLDDAARLDALWNQGLSRFGGPFLAGNRFTAVDAFFAPVAFRIQTYSPPLSAAGMQYTATLLGLPSMQSWYADALREPWRDLSHEPAALKNGTVLQDLRTG
jgi:glutathione S-transferase